MGGTVMDATEGHEVGSLVAALFRPELQVVKVHVSSISAPRHAATMMIPAKHGSARGGRNGLCGPGARASDSPALGLAFSVSAHVGAVGMSVVDVYFGVDFDPGMGGLAGGGVFVRCSWQEA